MSRLLCSRCERPSAVCVCAFAPPVQNEVELLVLQHPNEQHEAKGTARLLSLSLRHCRVLVGEHFEPPVDERENWLLYPGELGGTPKAMPKQLRLIVLDGSWGKSRKLLHLNPWLQALPRINLQAEQASAYAGLRKAERSGQLSTLEAATLALQQMENRPERYAPLLAGFAAFVAAQLARRPVKTSA